MGWQQSTGEAQDSSRGMRAKSSGTWLEGPEAFRSSLPHIPGTVCNELRKENLAVCDSADGDLETLAAGSSS